MNLREFERILPPSQRWENLTLANDFVFGKIMHNSELCAEMMSRILPGIDIGRIEFTQPQQYEKFSLDTRGVRFDVYAKSDNRKIFDCEVQTSNKKDLPQRTRAYHSLIGMKALEKRVLKDSGSYIDMPDVFVIFICTFDPFNRGRHIYSFSNMCSEVDGLELNDGARTVFLNTKGRADDVNGELKVFLDFVMGISSDDPFIMKLEEELTKLKQNIEWRQEYMLASLRDWEKCSEARAEGFAEGHTEGFAEGHTEGFAEGRTEGFAEGQTKGFTDGHTKGVEEAVEFMRKQGISDEQIGALRASVLGKE